MKPLPVKVQDLSRTKRCGVVVSSYNDLLNKGREKLAIPKKIHIRLCLESDGTDISDDTFLSRLAPNSVIIVLRPGECWMGYWSYLLNAFEEAKKIHPLHQAKERIEQVLHLTTDNAKLSTIATFLSGLSNKRQADNRADDPDWFEDLPPTAKSKECVMKNGARSRVRSYFYTAKKCVQGAVTKLNYEKYFSAIFDEFSRKLVKNDYYGGYFGRTVSEELRLCDAEGWFNCEGPFDADFCPQTHLINPFDNKESRLVFSTWNLDHQAEKSRTVVPGLIQSAINVPKCHRLNVDYFYSLLFTKINLRLVHIACHKKCEHGSKKLVDEMFFIRTGNAKLTKRGATCKKDQCAEKLSNVCADRVTTRRRCSKDNGA
ncbi:DNA fragmentation factor subunit beta-like [Paramacrobiotus metropolitanus]|uniref:DNA fragmentation factor subunit beta-like n=1 Tax=Paramacrobiotus metropolitanus TaxID=2943436 RepID=UPI00244610AB|nr:DNA fragmentation factor subunit beta-like [Paramacrobiotus metropolitanus]